MDPATFRSAITYDDVLLVPKHSPVKTRSDVKLTTKLTRNITINNPIVSSNMDTVTETDMAITMARNGGIGIIHRFLSVEDQVAMIEKVKRAESVKIENPYTTRPNVPKSILDELMEERGVTSFLVTDQDSEGKLLGIVTRRDLRFAGKNQLVSELMTPRERLFVGDDDITLEAAKELIHRHRLEKLPLVDKENRLRGLITARDILNQSNRPYASYDRKGRLLVGAAVGVKDGFLERAAALVKTGADVLVVDIAHGDSDLAITATRQLKAAHPEVDVIAGNVASADGTRALIEAGADAVKVGVGPGSICITRIVTGCGVPQLTAVLDCVREARKHGVPIMADGGVRTSGDIVKALAAGASTLMLGSMLAGTEESPGKVLTKDGKKVKVIRGMAGYGANLSKRQRENLKDDLFDIVPEGVEALVPYRGHVSDIIKQLVGGIKSGISYCGGHSIGELQQNAEFVKITGAGKAESSHHDVEKI